MFMEFLANAGARVVVQTVYVAEFFQRGGDHPIAILLFRDVDLRENCLPAILGD